VELQEPREGQEEHKVELQMSSQEGWKKEGRKVIRGQND
jgi:hypothetical protein